MGYRMGSKSLSGEGSSLNVEQLKVSVEHTALSAEHISSYAEHPPADVEPETTTSSIYQNQLLANPPLLVDDIKKGDERWIGTERHSWIHLALI